MSDRHALSRFKRYLAPAVCAVTLLIPVLIWIVSAGNPFDYFTHQVPPGQAFFVLSKLCALLAFALFWLQCMTALAKFAPALRGFLHLERRQHALLGGATFTLLAAHVALFVAASSLRTGHFAGVLLIPKFDQGFYNAHISYGAVAFWVLALVVLAGAARMHGHVQSRWLHRAVFVAFGLALLHGTSIGSETRFGLMQYVYAFSGLSLAMALCSWAWFRVRLRVHRASRGESALASPVRTAVSSNE